MLPLFRKKLLSLSSWHFLSTHLSRREKLYEIRVDLTICRSLVFIMLLGQTSDLRQGKLSGKWFYLYVLIDLLIITFWVMVWGTYKERVNNKRSTPTSHQPTQNKNNSSHLCLPYSLVVTGTWNHQNGNHASSNWDLNWAFD